MSRGLDTFIYYATAPIRLFGRSRYFRWALASACVAGLLFVATLWAINRLLPPSDSGLPDALAIMKPPPPLQPVTRASHVIAPVAVSLAAIGHTLDTATPREFTGKSDNPVTQLLDQAEIGLTVSRGTVQGDTWTYEDESTMGGRLIRTRVTMKELSPTSYTFRMEALGADGTWPLIESRATKVRPE